MAPFTLSLQRIEVLGREIQALTHAEQSVQNQLRALLRPMHRRAATAGTLLTDPVAFATYLEHTYPSDTLVSHAGDQPHAVTHAQRVPAWLRTPPRLKVGTWPAAEWHPALCLWTREGAWRSLTMQTLYLQTVAFHPVYRAIEKNFATLVTGLPIWTDWGAAIRGISAYGLGVLLAETGDLWWYPTVAKVWTRFGVGLYQGERQRRKAHVTEAEARAMAYDPRRRSVLYNTQIGLQNQNKTPDGTAGVYRQLYLDRKVVEAQKAPALPKVAWHRRAGRYMVKRFLRDVWLAWRQTMPRPAEIPMMQEAVAWTERQVLAAAD